MVITEEYPVDCKHVADQSSLVVAVPADIHYLISEQQENPCLVTLIYEFAGPFSKRLLIGTRIVLAQVPFNCAALLN